MLRGKSNEKQKIQKTKRRYRTMTDSDLTLNRRKVGLGALVERLGFSDRGSKERKEQMDQQSASPPLLFFSFSNQDLLWWLAYFLLLDSQRPDNLLIFKKHPLLLSNFKHSFIFFKLGVFSLYIFQSQWLLMINYKNIDFYEYIYD